MNIRKWLRILHRDFGYVATGLTIVYAISGIAVNHTSQWNPNYNIEKSVVKITPLPDSMWANEGNVNLVLNKLNEKGKVKNTFRPDPQVLEIYVEGNTISADFEKGEISQEKVHSRPVLKEANFLHLNHAKKSWTYVADAFAVILIFLAVSGLFMVKGKKGFTSRGWWLAAIGAAIPIIYLLLYY